MRLLASTDFALRALMRLAAEPDRHMNTEELAREIGVPHNHLQKLVQALAEAGLALEQTATGVDSRDAPRSRARLLLRVARADRSN